MYIKSKSKYLLVFLLSSSFTLIAGEYFSFSGISDNRELILSCNDNIYYPMLFTGDNLAMKTEIDIKIPQKRIPRISTRYNNTHSVYLNLKNTSINYNGSKNYYLKNQ